MPEKNPHLSTTSVGSFQRNPPYRVGEIIFADEIPYGDEIRLDGGRVDFITQVCDAATGSHCWTTLTIAK